MRKPSSGPRAARQKVTVTDGMSVVEEVGEDRSAVDVEEVVVVDGFHSASM